MQAAIDLEEYMFIYKRKLQVFLDRVQPMKKERYACLAFMLCFFLLRMFMQQGYAVIAYLLGLYYLNNIMLYLQPADQLEDLSFEDISLPTREQDEYKGF